MLKPAARMNVSIADIRKDYQLAALSESSADPSPLKQFEQWWQDAINSQIDEVNAMTLATSSPDGVPSARIVLLKGFSERGFTFFTNYQSYKGKQLEENPRACLVFFWKELERQVRITGLVSRIAELDSDTYYKSRPVSSQIGALVSPQSRVIESREWLEEKVLEITHEYKSKPIQRPSNWGGYLVMPISIEFWQGRPSRLHDRIQYTLNDEGGWVVERLAP